jgi:hypothetical protein
MLSHNETRKMAIKSHSNVKPKHEVLAYQYLKKTDKTYRYFTIKSYRYRHDTNLSVPKEVKKSKPKSPVRKLKKARRTSCCSRSAEEATCQRPGSATPDSQLHYSLTYRYLSNKELKKSK